MSLGLFNMLPIFPMDGGRLLRALLALRLDYLRATWWAMMIGRVVMVLVLTLALFYLDDYTLVALFAVILYFGQREYRQLQQEDAFRIWSLPHSAPTSTLTGSTGTWSQN
jgi:Zn-dependent protease